MKYLQFAFLALVCLLKCTRGAKLTWQEKNFLWAAENGNEEAVQRWLDDGVNVNVKNSRGYTALHYASMNGHLEVMNQLIRAGAYLYAKTGWQKTPLDWARNPEVKEALKNAIKIQEDFHTAAQEGNVDEVNRVLEDGIVNVDVRDKDYRTALYYAAVWGKLGVVNLLLANGADVKAQDFRGQTALHVASSRGNKDIVNKLINAKADPNIEDKGGNTALYYARQNGNDEIVPTLLEYQKKATKSALAKSDAAKTLHSDLQDLVVQHLYPKPEDAAEPAAEDAPGGN